MIGPPTTAGRPAGEASRPQDATRDGAAGAHAPAAPRPNAPPPEANTTFAHNGPHHRASSEAMERLEGAAMVWSLLFSISR